MTMQRVKESSEWNISLCRRAWREPIALFVAYGCHSEREMDDRDSVMSSHYDIRYMKDYFLGENENGICEIHPCYGDDSGYDY